MFSNGVTIMMPPSTNKDKEKLKEKDNDKEKVKDIGSEKKPSADESVCRSSICKYDFLLFSVISAEYFQIWSTSPLHLIFQRLISLLLTLACVLS